MIVAEPPHVQLASGRRSRAGSGPRSSPEAGRVSPLVRKSELKRFLAVAIDAVGLPGDVSVLLTDDETMRGLNRQFRKKNKPTDVLSFPAPELEDPPLKRSRTRHAGDVAISLTTAARQAEAFEHPLEVEVKILLLHGLLHLAGFDHETDGGEMARREAELRQKFGLPAGLIARSGDSVGDSKKQRRRVRS